MEKKKLNLNELSVRSFVTNEEKSKLGGQVGTNFTAIEVCGVYQTQRPSMCTNFQNNCFADSCFIE